MSPTLHATTDLDAVVRGLVALLTFVGLIVALSGLGLLKSRKRRSADPPSVLRVVAGGLLAIAGLTLKVMHGGRAGDEPEVISPTRFSSATSPTLTLDAPAGWLLSHDRAAGRLVATGPKASLMLETSRMSDGVHADDFMAQLATFTTSRGGIDEGAFSETLDGLPASARSFKFDTTAQAVWYVPRGGPLVTTISCRSEGGAAARDACRPLLSNLKWRPPGPL